MEPLWTRRSGRQLPSPRAEGGQAAELGPCCEDRQPATGSQGPQVCGSTLLACTGMEASSTWGSRGGRRQGRAPFSLGAEKRVGTYHAIRLARGWMSRAVSPFTIWMTFTDSGIRGSKKRTSPLTLPKKGPDDVRLGTLAPRTGHAEATGTLRVPSEGPPHRPSHQHCRQEPAAAPRERQKLQQQTQT